MIPRLLMFLTLAVTSCHGQRKMPSNCSELLIDGDNKVDKMIPNFNKYDVGYKDVNDFDQRYCREFPSWFKVGKAYKPCLKPFPGQLLSMIMSSVKKAYTRFCTSEVHKQEAWSHMRCLTPETKSQHQEVGNMFTSYWYYTANVEDLDEAIPALCCGAKVMRDKGYLYMENICSSIGMKGSGTWLAKVVDDILTEGLHIICGGYLTREECNNRKPGLIDRMDSVIQSNQTFNHSIIIPVVKLLKRLDGQITIDEDDTH